MKTIYSFVILATLLIGIASVTGNTAAQTNTPTPSPTPAITSEEQDEDTIEKIKNLVASRAAELKLVDKRGVFGTVKRSTSSQIVIEDHKRNQRTIDIDELTKFISNKDSFGISDIKEGDKISAVGFYNKDTKRLRASFISLSANIPIEVEGVVTDRKSREFTLAVVDLSGKPRTIDIETSTKTSAWNEEEIVKSGFSKIAVGERIIIIGFEDRSDKNIINASRIIHFPNMPLPQALRGYIPSEATSPSAPTTTPTKSR